MKPVIEFCRRGTDVPEIYACGKCGQYWAGEQGRDIAAEHCLPGKCGRCGCETPPRRLRCSSCSELDRFDKADRVNAADYDGPVVFNDYFFASVDDFMDSIDDEPPSYVWATHKRIGCAFDADYVVEHLQENTYEDLEVEAKNELFAFFEKWNAKQAQVWYEERSDLAVILENK